MEFKRGETTFREILHESEASDQNYPYRPAGYPSSKAHPMGIILVDDLNPMWIVELLEKLAIVKAKNILLMTSVIMEPLVAALLGAFPTWINSLEKETFFLGSRAPVLGGNIILGDLYTCSDYIEGVRDFEEIIP